MNPAVGSELLTSVGQRYLPSPKHRGTSGPDNSVWTISVSHELDCFVQAWQGAWGTDGTELWGHNQGGHGLEPLGVNFHDEDLWFGKFIGDDSGSPWHGYPADYRRKLRDRPPTEVLTQWRSQGIMTKQHATRVSRGQSCRF